MVEDPPLLRVIRVVVSDSESVLVTTDVLTPEEGSVGLQLSLKLEFDTILEWLLWPFDALDVDLPSLSSMVSAHPVGNSVLVSVGEAVRSDDVVAPILDLVLSVEERSLVDRVDPLSGNDVVGVGPTSGTDDSGDGQVSLVGSSDRLGSSIEDEPLSSVPWSVILDLDFELSVSNVSG